jgi:hypothetical protein
MPYRFAPSLTRDEGSYGPGDLELQFENLQPVEFKEENLDFWFKVKSIYGFLGDGGTSYSMPGVRYRQFMVRVYVDGEGWIGLQDKRYDDYGAFYVNGSTEPNKFATFNINAEKTDYKLLPISRIDPEKGYYYEVTIAVYNETTGRKPTYKYYVGANDTVTILEPYEAQRAPYRFS